MNKKLNYLAVIPAFGSAFLFLYLFIKMVKQEVNPKKFHACFISSAIFGFFSILIVALSMNFVDSFVDISIFLSNYGLAAAFIIGGYILNSFVFVLINRKWNDIESL